MFRDYGKMAYVKVIELEKRFEKIQKDLFGAINNSLSFDLVTPEKRAVFNKDFSCKALKSSTLILKIDLESSITLPLDYVLSLNGSTVQTGVFEGGKGVFDLQMGVGEGNLNFRLEFSAPIPFTLTKLLAIIDGNVEYINEFSRLSAINVGQISYLTAVNKNKLIIYGYDEDGLSEIYKINDVKDASIGGYVNDELYVLYIDTSNVLRVLIYDPSSFMGVIANLNSNGATSVCGHVYGDGIKVYYVLTGNVYSGVYVKNGYFKGEKINRKGVKVTCEPSVLGVYVISDASNSNKLVTGDGTYVLPRGKSHHVTKTQAGYTITYSDKNVLYSQDVDGSLTTPKQIDYCDEKVELYDGNYLVRVVDSLKIRKG